MTNNSTNNQVNGWFYDCAGNVTGIPVTSGATQACGTTPTGTLFRTATYDAESRMVSVTDSNGNTSTYVYDGDGRRVQKTTPSGTTVYVYDPIGNLAQEYGPSSSSGTEYLSTDALGSTRLVTDSSGDPLRCYDYLPFGQELAVGTAGRPTSSCYTTATYPLSSPDVVSEKFTSKERDAETGLDFFGARHFSSAQGRFTSTDPNEFSNRTIANPQKWNKYAYVLNNPLASWSRGGPRRPGGLPHDLGPNPSLGKTKDAADPNGAKAPGKPGEREGFKDPRSGPKWGKAPNGKSGWVDAKGNVWVPTGQAPRIAHGGPPGTFNWLGVDIRT